MIRWGATGLATPELRSWWARLAAQTVLAGGIIAYPTEAVYGLGCDPRQAAAVARLVQLKRRPPDKGLILVAADFERLRPFLGPLPAAMLRAPFATWPGPHTWLLPASPTAPRWLVGTHQRIAVRVTAHPIAAELCRVCDTPLVSTSANPSGRPAARSPLQVRQYFGAQIGVIIHGRLGSLPRPTPIRDAVTGAWMRR